MSFLEEYDFPKNQKELYNHPNFSHRHSFSKVVKGYEYSNENVDGFCKWMHYEDQIQDVYFYSYGNLIHKIENDTYIFTITCKKYCQFDYYAARVDIASGNIVYNYELDTYTPIGKWKHEHIIDQYSVNNILYEKTNEVNYYTELTGYDKIEGLVDYIRKDVNIPGE